MRERLIQGLKWSEKPDYEGRMFLTDFTEETARKTVSTIESELSKLKLLGGKYSAYRSSALARLITIASDNLELFVYGIKAGLTHHDYIPPNQEHWNNIVDIIAETIEKSPEKCMPLFRHMLKIWPHTQSWCVVSNLMAQAYGEIRISDEECIDIVAKGLLRDASSWESALNAMMRRAYDFPEETLKQFEAVFNFMAIYGESMRGKQGIQLSSTIYTSKQSEMRHAFEEQPESIQSKLREMRSVYLANARPMLDATRGMEQREEDVSCFPEVESLIREGRLVEAQKCLSEKFSVWKESGMSRIKSPELVDLIGNLMRQEDYSFNDKQRLIYRLSSYIKQSRENEDASAARQRAFELLDTYTPTNDTEEEAILAGCAKMMARANSGTRAISVTDEMSGKMYALIERHANMEVYARRLVDGAENRKGIWRLMLGNYGLHPLLRSVVERMLQYTPLSDTNMIRSVYKILAITYDPAGHDRRILNNAVPNEKIADHIIKIMAYDDGVFKRSWNYMHDVLPAVTEALSKFLTQETYNNYYREVVTLLNIYCAELPVTEQRRIRAVLNTVHGWADDFHSR